MPDAASSHWDDQQALPPETHAWEFSFADKPGRWIATPACLAGLKIEAQDRTHFLGWGKEGERAVVVNGLGCSLGDALYGLRALELVAEERGIKNVTALMSQVYVSATTLEAHGLHPLIQRVEQMPCPVPRREDFEVAFDLTAMPLRTSFLQTPMIDAFLEEMGSDATRFTPEEKLPRPPGQLGSDWRPPLALQQWVESLKRPRLLLNPFSRGAIRSMPLALAEKICARLKPDAGIFLLDEEVQKITGGLLGYDWLVSQMDGVISVDTSTYHLAAMNRIPSLVFFTTIPPALRLAYLPKATGYAITPPGAFEGMHWPTPEALAHFSKAWNDSLLDVTLQWVKSL